MEIWKLIKGCFTKTWNEEKAYVAKILLSMIPIFVVGVFFKDQVESLFGSGLLIVGCCLLLTSLLLAFAYYAKPRQRETISYRDAFIIGIAQACAVLPGLSRSGSTIATGLLLGNKKESIAQFSFLMVLAPILGDALLETMHILQGEVVANIPLSSLLIGFLAAYISGCFACKFMIRIVQRGKLIYFAAYCLIAGGLAILLS
jgi:undecaprenyl-diphosphatase